MQLLITFPNLFELKRFTEQFDLNRGVMRKAVIRPPSFISFPAPIRTSYLLNYLKHKFPTARVVSKTPAESGFKYTTLQKGAF